MNTKIEDQEMKDKLSEALGKDPMQEIIKRVKTEEVKTNSPGYLLNYPFRPKTLGELLADPEARMVYQWQFLGSVTFSMVVMADQLNNKIVAARRQGISEHELLHSLEHGEQSIDSDTDDISVVQKLRNAMALYDLMGGVWPDDGVKATPTVDIEALMAMDLSQEKATKAKKPPPSIASTVAYMDETADKTEKRIRKRVVELLVKLHNESEHAAASPEDHDFGNVALENAGQELPKLTWWQICKIKDSQLAIQDYNEEMEKVECSDDHWIIESNYKQAVSDLGCLL